MTLEEEFQSIRPRKRRDGFSDDGLSYSVAGDYDKLLGQALSEFEARTADPRFVPGARVEQPDAPDLLRQELIDPLIMTGVAGSGRAMKPAATPSPRLFKSGNDVISVNPLTGQSEVVFEGVAKPDNRLADYELGRIRDQQRQWNELRTDPFKKAAMNLTDDAIEAQMQKLDEQARGILAPTPASGPAAPVSPRISIGEETISPIKPGERGKTEVTKTLKNGRKAVFNSETKEFIRYAD
jgi:hypothetical protein